MHSKYSEKTLKRNFEEFLSFCEGADLKPSERNYSKWAKGDFEAAETNPGISTKPYRNQFGKWPSIVRHYQGPQP